MIYVEVNFNVAAADKDAALDCLIAEVPQMQSLPGNQGSKVLADPRSDGAITLLHQWDTLGDLDAYRNGPLLAKVGSVLRPMMTAAPTTTVYEATRLG